MKHGETRIFPTSYKIPSSSLTSPQTKKAKQSIYQSLKMKSTSIFPLLSTLTPLASAATVWSGLFNESYTVADFDKCTFPPYLLLCFLLSLLS